MKNKLNFVLPVMLFLVSCGSMPAMTQTTQTPTVALLPTFTPHTFAPIFALTGGVTSTYPPYHTPTPTDTATPTSTPDYAALGIPSPTPTPTFEYDRLSSFYLTPFTPWPTSTVTQPLTPTATIPNILSSVVIRRISPQPPPARKVYDNLQSQDYAEWLHAYIQSATDLMNYIDGNKNLYYEYINSWSPTALKFSPNDWFLENDYDNNGQSEWLISIPTQDDSDGAFHCGDVSFDYCHRYFFVFEKKENSYYPVDFFSTTYDKVVLIDDLNDNQIQDIVFQSDVCGSACSTSLRIGEWNGGKWSEFWVSSEMAEVAFADIDNNGITDISLKYSTGAASKYNFPYPFRKGLVDVYGWQNERYELIDQIYPPTESVFAIMFDVSAALDYKNAELAFIRINPIIETLDQSCDRMKTYVGIQAMLAYGFQNDSSGMKSVLTKLEKYCDFPRNAYLPAARILWLAYEKSHDAIGACQAMERFLWKEYTRENGRFEETLFVDWYPTHRPSCPRE